MLADERELHLKAWLYAIARNRCISILRARRERLGLDGEIERAASTAGLSAEVERREDLRALLGDLGRLPEDQRAALLLAELGNHSHDEVAEVLGVKRNKVKALVFQAREALAAARAARETPCAEIREELANARGGALRRSNLRRHLDVCEGCRAFRDEVHRQRAALAIILPVAPSFALKQAVLAGATATAAGLGVAGAGVGAGAVAAAGGKAVAGKLLAVAVIVGGAGGTGYVAVNAVHSDKPLPVPTASAAPTELGPRPVALRVADSPSVAATPLPERPEKRTHGAAAASAGHVAAKREHGRAVNGPHHRRHRARQAEAPPTVTWQRAQPLTGHHRLPRSDGPARPNSGPSRPADHGEDRRKPHPRGAPPGQLKRDDPNVIMPPPGHRRDDDGERGHDPARPHEG
jgi:hypothetical protein